MSFAHSNTSSMDICDLKPLERYPFIYSAFIRVQLDIARELAAKSKGKQREGTISDADLALRWYTEDLRRCEADMTERPMVHSVAARLREEDMVRRNEQERISAWDHVLAQQLGCDMESVESGYVAPVDPCVNDEILAKLCASYTSDSEPATGYTGTPREAPVPSKHSSPQRLG